MGLFNKVFNKKEEEQPSIQNNEYLKAGAHDKKASESKGDFLESHIKKSTIQEADICL